MSKYDSDELLARANVVDEKLNSDKKYQLPNNDVYQDVRSLVVHAKACAKIMVSQQATLCDTQEELDVYQKLNAERAEIGYARRSDAEEETGTSIKNKQTG